jgi:hypothetical protein
MSMDPDKDMLTLPAEAELGGQKMPPPQATDLGSDTPRLLGPCRPQGAKTRDTSKPTLRAPNQLFPWLEAHGSPVIREQPQLTPLSLLADAASEKER